MAALDALVDAADADTRIRALRVREELGRKLEFENLRMLARIHRDWEFETRDTSTVSGVADVLWLSVGRARARRGVRVAEALFPTSLTGAVLRPRMPATAAALGALGRTRM